MSNPKRKSLKNVVADIPDEVKGFAFRVLGLLLLLTFLFFKSYYVIFFAALFYLVGEIITHYTIKWIKKYGR